MLEALRFESLDAIHSSIGKTSPHSISLSVHTSRRNRAIVDSNCIDGVGCDGYGDAI
jgi:hypothetical protein